jgi:hypothetical protein
VEITGAELGATWHASDHLRFFAGGDVILAKRIFNNLL